MPYELAKKLKQAGFPQHGRSHNDNGSIAMLTRDDNDKAAHAMYVPTLEELINACDALVEGCVFLSGHKDQWSAIDGQDGFGIYGGDGQTPTEAVARLWLALKSK